MKSIMALVLLLVLFGCAKDDKDRKVTEISVGKVVSVSYHPETFSAWAKTVILTDGGTFIISGSLYALTGEPVRLATYTNGKQYLCFDSKTKCYYIK